MNKFKDKISNIAGGEVLGETNKVEEDMVAESSPRPRPRPNKKENPSPSPKPKPKETSRKPVSNDDQVKKPRRTNDKPPVKEDDINRKSPLSKFSSVFSKKDVVPEEVIAEVEIEETHEDKNDDNDFYRTHNAIEGYDDVLSILGIKEVLEPDGDFNSKDMDYIEFTQTQPLGLSHEEVTDFISRMKYTLHKLETALKQRDRDIVRVASEVKKVEQKMIERNQKEEMERMIGGMTEEERLIEENMELKVEINGLVNRVKKMSEGSESNIVMERRLEALQAENEMLRMNSVGGDFVPTTRKKGSNKLPYIKEKSNKLPTFNDNESKDNNSGALPSFNDNENVDDMIERQQDEMIKELGGFYDE